MVFIQYSKDVLTPHLSFSFRGFKNLSEELITEL